MVFGREKGNKVCAIWKTKEVTGGHRLLRWDIKRRGKGELC